MLVPGGRARRFVTLAVVFAAYVLAGKLGLSLAFVNASASAVWPPTGIAIAAVLLLGTSAWPAILAGAFVVNATTSGDLLSSAGIAVGNTLEAIVARELLIRSGTGTNPFRRPQDVPLFALYAAMIATAVSATIGASMLAFTGLARWSDFAPVWLTWWLGDSGGALVVTPAIVLWAGSPRPFARENGIEALLLAVATVASAVLVFGGLGDLSKDHYPVAYILFPALIWAAFRFGPRAAATATLCVAVIAVWGTLNGFGPYAGRSPNESLLLLQGFMTVAAVTSLTLAAAVLDRRRTADEAARLREDFLSTATHELRTPVTSLSGYAQLALRGLRDGEMHRVNSALSSMMRQSNRVARLITQLLDATHASSDELLLSTEPTDISALTAEIADLTKVADAERHAWDIRITPRLSADVDPLRWEQLVRNLLDNAERYTPAGGQIGIRLERTVSGELALVVTDSGIGISSDHVGRIFDRFYRAHAEKGLGGLGLGLYLVRRIAVAHGGRIDVATSLGGGSTFTVTLPAVRIVETTAREVPPSRRPADRTKGARILVVDDEPDIAYLVANVLRDRGYAVATAENGERALDAVMRERPDLIVLDKLMPIMDGTAFATAYHAASSHPAPIVAFCAARDAEQWARSIGAVAHIGKPFNIDELERVVANQLRVAAPLER